MVVNGPNRGLSAIRCGKHSRPNVQTHSLCVLICLLQFRAPCNEAIKFAEAIYIKNPTLYFEVEEH
ncbi:hypothetical protein M8C21_017407, partial [Ambrosia artemisiifolia]